MNSRGRVVAAMASILWVSSVALADFSMDELVDATKVALTKFKTDHPDHADHFVGYKVWKSADDAKAIVYVNHGGMNMQFNYVCHKHDTAIECHDQ